MNAEIARGVGLLPRAALVPSAGLFDVKADRIHFKTPGLRRFGLRYYSALAAMACHGVANGWESPAVNRTSNDYDWKLNDWTDGGGFDGV